jgi:hypothetical protein
MGWTLHNILVEVLLYIVAAIGLAISCLPRGTCCQHYHVFVSTTTAVVAVVAEALALRVHALAGPLGFRWFGVGPGVEAWRLELRCSWRAPPFGLSIVPSGL